MESFEKYQLKTNPFRVTPSNSDEIVWAGFHDLKEKIARRISLSVKIPNSSLVLNWGEYGSGKTHAAKYFNKRDVLAKLVGENAMPFSLIIDFPRGKEPIKDIFTAIIDKLDISELRRQFAIDDSFIEAALNQSTDNIFIKNVIKLMFSSGNDELFSTEINQSLFKGYLYGSADLKKFLDKGVQRKLSSENDYTEFLSALFSFLTYRKRVFSCVILWFDEFESINTLGNTNVGSINNFFRTIMDKTPDNLLVFLNLTQSVSMKLEDLSFYLQPAVKSRIKARIELNVPNPNSIKEYFCELINNSVFRIEGDIPSQYFPFEENVIDSVIKDLGETFSLRDYNEVFSAILEYADEFQKNIIDIAFYNEIKDDIIGWKD